MQGGANTAANILLFKRQTEYYNKNDRQPIPEWAELPEFNNLQQHMREAAAMYLSLHGHSEDHAAELAGGDSRRRDCHSAAPPSIFIRYFNMDGEGMSAK